MKKQTILLIAFLIVITGFFSGCNQENNEKKVDLNKVELVNYTIEFREDLTGEEYREITGYVNNNAGIEIKEIKIEVRFYDINDNLLNTKYSYIYNLANKQTEEFSTIYHSMNDYYFKVDWDNIEFEIIIN